MLETDILADQDGNTTVAVRPKLRLIPNGTRLEGDQVVLSATLLLSPVPVEEGGKSAGAMILVNWPRDAARLMASTEAGALAHIAVSFSPTRMGEFGVPPDRSVPAEPVRLARPSVIAAMDDEKIQAAWSHSLVDRDVADKSATWQHLATTLSAVHSGTAIEAGQGFKRAASEDEAPPDGAETLELSQPAFGVDGQIRPERFDSKQPLTCETILGTGLPDANVLLQRLRARECMETLKDKGSMAVRDVDGWDDGHTETPPILPTLDELTVTEDDLDRAIAELGPQIPLVIPRKPHDDGRTSFAVAAEAYDTLVFNKLKPLGLLEKEDKTEFNLVTFRTEKRDQLAAARETWMKAERKERKVERFRKLAGDADRETAWEAFGKAATREITPVCDYGAVDASESSAKEEREALAKTVGKSEYGHWPSYESEEDEGAEERTETPADRDTRLQADAALELVTQSYFGIEGNPGLARAFGLAFDLEIGFPAARLRAHPYGTVLAELKEGSPFAGADGAHVYTRIKLRRPTDAGRVPDWGWPVTSAEVMLWANGQTALEVKEPLTPGEGLDARCLSQFEGVVVMGGVPGAAHDAEGSAPATVPRFDVATLDVAAAMEAERRWLDAVKAAERAPNVASDELRDLLAVGPDYQSNGLTLLNRAAIQDAVRKLLALHRKTGEGARFDERGDDWVIHDAEDLTNGFRLLIGVPAAVTGMEGAAQPDVRFPTTWRSLMGRQIKYGRTGSYGQAVERCLAAALGPPGDPARVELEGAMQAIPSRSLPTGKENAVETIVTEDFGQWDGNPGGVPCARVKGNPPPVQDSNAFGRQLDLPSGEAVAKPPQLRFGRPYRFAIQAVYSGGRAIPLGEMPVEDRKAVDVTSRLYFPSRALTRDSDGEERTAVPYFRALRHARIGAPTVLLPEGHATRDITPMGYDSTGKMIVRTMREVDAKTEEREITRERPRIAQRLVLVPPLPQAIAARHMVADGREGILDADESVDRPPKGALSDIEYDQVRDSGFPVARTSTVRGINDRRYITGREIVAGAGAKAFDDESEEANAVYEPRSGTGRTTYYPDPAAERLVLRLRRAASDPTLRPALEGDPLSIDLTGPDYPERRRVLLSLRAEQDRLPAPEKLLQQGDVMKDRLIKRIRAGRTGDIVASSGHEVHEVAFLLRPGEHFLLEMWQVPSPLRLARDFAMIQTLAQNAVAGREDMADAVRDYFTSDALGEIWWQNLKERLRRIAAGGVEGPRYVGFAGGIVPGTAILHSVATAVHEAMLHHPVHELSAVRRIELVHAVNKPAAAPVVRTLAPGQDPFPAERPRLAAHLGRPAPSPGGTEPAPVRALRPETLDTTVPGFSTPTAIAAGSKHLMLAGEVAVNLEEVDTIEILARCVSPDRAVFDDPKRGRSLAHRLAGTWPEGLQAGEEGNEAAPILRQAHEIFGFGLARDGRVRLPVGEVTLLRIQDIRLTGAFSDRFLLDLAAHFVDPPGAPTDDMPAPPLPDRRLGRVGMRHLFPDGKARRLELRFNGLARTAEMMETAARKLQSGDPWLTTTGLVHERGDLVDAQPLPRQLLENVSPPVEVIMPATARPAEPPARTAGHAIERLEEELKDDRGRTTLRVTQRAQTRLRFGRGWFSSGVDERVGLVTWPPNQAAADAAGLGDNTVMLRPEPDSHDRTPTLPPGACPTTPLGDPQIPTGGREVPLPKFQDEDLGPGGRFITRRGMDPTRLPKDDVAEPETQIFLSKEAFPDLWRHPTDPARAEYVPHALMPLGDANGTDGEEEGNDGTDGEEAVDTVPPMACGLVTYMPRFDPVAEEWYCDVHLAPGKRADQIVRFGVVRYQPHTRPDLRCSRPAQVFCQPLPDRQVDVRFSEDSKRIVVTMTGPTSVGRVFEAIGDQPPLSMTERQSNVMRITAFADGEAALGGATREHVAIGYDEVKGPLVTTRIDPGVIEVQHDAGLGGWKAEIPLDAVPRGLLRRLSLRVEEIDYRLPSDFQDTLGEPLDPLKYGLENKRLASVFRERNAGLDVTGALARVVPEDILSADEAEATETARHATWETDI